MKKRKFFGRINKLIFVFLLICAFITCIVTFIQYSFSNRNETIQDKETLLLHISQKIDQNMEILKKMIEIYCESEQTVAYNQNITEYNRLVAMQSLSNLFSNFNAMGINVSYFNPNDSYVLGSSMYTEKEEFFRVCGIEPNEVYKYIEDVTSFSLCDVNALEDEVIFIFKNRIIAKTSGIFVIKISNTFFADKIPEHDSFYLDVMGMNIHISGKSRTIPTLSTNVNILDKDIIIVTESIGLPEMKYLYIIPNTLFNPTGLIMIILFFALISMLLWYLSYKSTQFIYKPIGEMFKTVGMEDDVSDEFDYISTRILQTQEYNKELEKSIEVKSEILKDKVLTDIVIGLMNSEMAEKLLKEYGMEGFFNNGCFVSVLNVDELLNEDENPPDVNLAVYAGIGNYLNKKCREMGMILLGIEQGRFIILSACKVCNSLKNILNQLIYEMADRFNIISTATIGSYAETPEQLYKSYSEAMMIRETQRHVLLMKNVISIEDSEPIEEVKYDYPLETERYIINYIAENQGDKAYALINNVLNRNLTELNLSAQQLVEFRFAIVSTIKRLLQKLNLKEEDVFDDGNYSYLELSMCKKTDELYEAILEQFRKIIKWVSHNNRSEDSELIYQIIEYIQQNYSKDLSLLDISETFGISTYYISRLFKTKLNVNFKQFLNTCRIEKAKEILDSNPDITVSELASKVGFNRAATFYRVFKELEGDTPKGYSSKRKE